MTFEELFRIIADEIVCATTPDPFFGVGRWYEDFSQTSDDEVRDMFEEPGTLEEAARLARDFLLQHLP